MMPPRRSHRRFIALAAALTLAALACSEAGLAGGSPGATEASSDPGQTPGQPTAERDSSAFESDRIAFGFFPSPPEGTLESVLNHFQDMGEHGDFILIQPNIPWEGFVGGIEGDSQARTDLVNQTVLARQNDLAWIVVVDPLNGLNRREFFGLPDGWQASFGNPDVRAAFSNFALWIVREFSPRYLGLASEINTYLDAHPEDVENYLSLYRQVYDRVKAEAPETQVFVTFQWEDLNNVFPEIAEGRRAYETNWDQVEAFEPELDVWVISSYPFIAFPSGADIPDDYYTPLLERTSKPLALGEGGYTSKPIGPFPGAPSDQVLYLEAIDQQLGERLAFWTYLLLSDFDPEAYADAMRDQGRSEADIQTLGMFQAVGLRQADGSAKPALAVWDNFRGAE